MFDSRANKSCNPRSAVPTTCGIMCWSPRLDAECRLVYPVVRVPSNEDLGAPERRVPDGEAPRNRSRRAEALVQRASGEGNRQPSTAPPPESGKASRRSASENSGSGGAFPLERG